MMEAAVCLHPVQIGASEGIRRIGEIALHHFRVQADDFKELRALISLQGGNAHLGGNLEDACRQCGVVCTDGIGSGLFDFTNCAQGTDTVMGEVGIDCAGAVADEQGQLMDLPGFTAFQNHRDGGALFDVNQMLFQGRDCEQGGDREMRRIHTAVREDQDIDALPAGRIAR